MNQAQDNPVFITTVTFGNDGIITIDENLTIVQFNHSAESILGYRANEVVGRPLQKIFIDNNEKQHRDYLANFLNAGVTGKNMTDHKFVDARLANGNTISLNAYIYRTTYNRKNYISAIFQPIINKKRRTKLPEQGVVRSNNPKLETGLLLGSLTSTPYTQLLSRVGIIEHNLKDNSVYWSSEVYEILELNTDDVKLSENLFLEFVHPEDIELVVHMRQLSISSNSKSNKNKYVIRHRLLLKNNVVKYVECRCESFRDESNKLVRSLVILQDITDQVKLFQQQCHLQELLLKAEELSKTGSWEINLDTNKTYFSPEYFRLHNINPGNTASEDLYSIKKNVHRHDQDVFFKYMHDTKAQKIDEPILYRVTNSLGKIKYIKAKRELVKTNNDNTMSLYGFAQDITSYVNAEHKIQQTSELLRAVIDTTHICIAHLDRDMNFILVNKAYADADQKTPDYFIGKNHFRLYPNEENEVIFRNVIKTGQPYTVSAKPFEYEYSPERGVTHWDWTVIPIKNSTGQITGLVLTLLDVTERVNALEAAANNEKELSSINSNLESLVCERTLELESERNFIDAVLETQSVYVTVLNYYGHVVIFNNACEQCSGYEKNELGGKALWDVLAPPEEKREIIKAFDDLINSAQPSTFEYHWVTKQGEKRLIEWSNSVLKDKDGIVRYVIMTGVDITESRQTELLLKRAAGNLEVAQRITKIGDWEYEVQNEKLWWSEEYYNILGLNPDTHTPSKELYLQCVHENDSQKAKMAVNQLIEKGYKDIHLKIKTPGGETRIVHEIAQVEYNKLGKPVFLRGTVQDITDITKAEAERNQLQRQLQQAHKMESIGQLTGGIAHDFNNILAAILGFTRLAKTRFAPEAKGDLSDYLQEIEKAGLRASSLVKQMLAFSRGDTQDFTLLDPLPIIKESVNMLRSTIPSSINIIVEIKNENIVIETNALQLQQSIINLIINARDALNGKGEIYITVDSVKKSSSECVSCHKIFSGEYLAIRIRDNGCGIQPDILSRIFEPFFTTKPVGDGSGMGLAMVHGFIHSSGGHIEVDAAPGQGTAFNLYFPVTIASNNLLTEVNADEGIDSFPNTCPEHNILVVDDEESVVKYLQAFLSMQNYGVVATTSSLEALNLLKSDPEKFDLLITDQSMPELSGEELINKIQLLSLNIPVILCSGYSDLVSKDNFEEKGATFFLSKPIDQKYLLQAIKQLVEK